MGVGAASLRRFSVEDVNTHKRQIIGIAALAAAFAVGLCGCAANESPAVAPDAGSGEPVASASALSGTLSGSGATSAKAAQDKWIAQFQMANPGVTVNYSPVGSGAGRTAFIEGGAQFAGSDAALSDSESGGTFAGCAPGSKALDLPAYISPIAVVFNLDGVSGLTLDEKTLAGIFAGTITTWNDPAIAATNPGVTLPGTAITAVHRSDDSGTTQNFTDTLHALAGSVWTWDAASTWPDGVKGEAANGTSGVIQAVQGGSGTIGYADASQAGSLGKAKLLVSGKAVEPTAEAAAAIVDHSPLVAGRDVNDLALNLDRTSEGVYPAVLVSYLIVCQQYAKPADGALVKAYVGYVTSAQGQQDAASSAGSAPLSGAMQAKVAAAVASIR